MCECTAAVGVGRLRGPVLEAVEDLPLAHVAVTDQKELQKVVVALHRATLLAATIMVSTYERIRAVADMILDLFGYI